MQDDLRPTAPWGVCKSVSRCRCGSAAGAVADQVAGAVGDVLRGRFPRRMPAPDPRSTVDCACAMGGPREVAIASMAVVRAAGPLAASMFWHFLGASGSDRPIDVADVLRRSAGARAKIRQSMTGGRLTGTTRLDQSDLRDDRDLQSAYGASDCVQWQALPPRFESLATRWVNTAPGLHARLLRVPSRPSGSESVRPRGVCRVGCARSGAKLLDTRFHHCELEPNPHLTGEA